MRTPIVDPQNTTFPHTYSKGVLFIYISTFLITVNQKLSAAEPFAVALDSVAELEVARLRLGVLLRRFRAR